MININSIYNPDFLQCLEYHHNLLEIAAQARLTHEALQANPDKSSASHKWDWGRRLFPARHQHHAV